MLIAANWKMNLTYEQAQDLMAGYENLANVTDKRDTADGSAVSVIVFPPALYAGLASQSANRSSLAWGGQCCHSAEAGAHTGDISATMFASMGAEWQLVGHSERRSDHGESDQEIALQISSATKAALQIMLCVGESLEQRDAGQAEQIITAQIAAALSRGVAWEKIAIAYEPIWAIGTGKVAELEDIQAMHQAISEFCTSHFDLKQAPPVLYGGSVNADNARDILALPHVSGALVGGASLKIDALSAIVNAALP